MNRNAREVARIIRHIEANVLGVIGEIMARPEFRRRLLRATPRGRARKEIKRQLAAFERLVEMARRPGGTGGPKPRPSKTGGRTGKKEKERSQCLL